MTRRYDSFVVRCWRSGDQTLQVVVEHIQSGEQARSATMEDAFDWLSVQAGLKTAGDPLIPPAITTRDENPFHDCE